MNFLVVKYALAISVLFVVVAATTDTVVGAWVRSLGTKVASHPRLEFLATEARAAVEARLRRFLGPLAGVIGPRTHSIDEKTVVNGGFPVTSKAHGATPRRKSSFETLGADAFREVVADYGGDPARVVLDATVSDPLTGETLRFDVSYIDERASIAVDFKSLASTLYPNPFHLSRREFDDAAARCSEKALAASRAGALYIDVPYTVDRCEPDSREETGWRHISNLSDSNRRERIRRFIHSELIRRVV